MEPRLVEFRKRTALFSDGSSLDFPPGCEVRFAAKSPAPWSYDRWKIAFNPSETPLLGIMLSDLAPRSIVEQAFHRANGYASRRADAVKAGK